MFMLPLAIGTDHLIMTHPLSTGMFMFVLYVPAGWLLVLITSGAVACSIVFEKRLWCRYLCPIGEHHFMHQSYWDSMFVIPSACV